MNTPFRSLWPSLYGYFDFEEVYRRFVENGKDGDVFVEVGSLVGKSACFLGEAIYASGKNIRLVCVDPWPVDYVNEGHLQTLQPFDSFLANVRQSGLTNIITPLRVTSMEGSLLLRDNLGAVFIDARHDYANVRADIAAWRHKVRVGGILAGHDHSDTYPGVIQAVTEAFGTSYEVVGQSWLKIL